MTAQALALPVDITWQRFAFTRDMVDTDFGTLELSPKWRSSLAVYAYVVPEEETAESYPDARIVYLRLSCSITGWNPNEELANEIDLDEVGDQLDDLQRSSWEVVQGDRWSETYWPCLGAIAQVAVYPGRSDVDVDVDDFPYIVDFEPKKRELYETATDTGEFMSASSENISVQKGTTTVDHTEKSAKVGIAAPLPGGLIGSAEGGIKKSRDETAVDMRTTDTSREGRETRSFSTTFSQMYQLFNGYHLGTNRAVFAISPRPHIASGNQWVDFNLLDGERKLEGIQDMFLVVYVPKQLEGICVQANLDTGHDVELEPGRTYMARAIDDPPTHRDGEQDPIPPPPQPPPPPPPPPDEPVRRIVVTRRVARNCARFEPDGTLVLVGLPGRPPRFPPVVFEASLAETVARATLRRRSPGSTRPEERSDLVNGLNAYQRRVVNIMQSGHSAGRYRPRPFVETTTFARLAARSLIGVELDIDRLVDLEVLEADQAQGLRRIGVRGVGALFARELDTLDKSERATVRLARERVISAVRAARGRPPPDN
jgi:hypothetical protein